MLLQIPRVLSEIQLRQVGELLDQCQFVDGKLSAGSMAKDIKHNLEVSAKDGKVNQLNELVMGNLLAHPLYSAAAFPLKVASPFYAKYEAGMEYGFHVDDPIMGQQGQFYRSDISISLFLSKAEEYEGGELNIKTQFGEQLIKLPAGDAVMYPSSSLHRVMPVTRGVRLVAVTWVQSLIRQDQDRQQLYTLAKVRDELNKGNLNAEQQKNLAQSLDHVYVNYFRQKVELS